MIVISKKRIMLLTTIVVFSICCCTIMMDNNKVTVETVSLPVTNKTIVIDARTSESQMNGAQSSNRNYRS